jgi:hypothetical protein
VRRADGPAAAHQARVVASVVFPTPPFKLKTAIVAMLEDGPHSVKAIKGRSN